MKKVVCFFRILMLLLTIVMMSSCAIGGSKEFPNRNIKIIVPFDAGGGVDICCRTIAETAGNDYFSNHSLVIENVPGGGAIIGQTRVANSKADGYTLLASSSSIITNPIFNKTIFTSDSFQPIAMFCFDPQMLVVPKDSPYKALEDFVKAAKEQPLRMSTPGHTTAPHIAALEMESKMGVQFDYLHNNSANEQFQQLMGNHVDCALVSVGEGAALVEDGSIRALGIMGEEEMEEVPGVPTFTECGYDLVNGAFRGISVSKDTPQEIVDFLESEFEKILTSEQFIQSMKNANMPFTYKNAEDFQKVIDSYEETVLMLADQLQ